MAGYGNPKNKRTKRAVLSKPKSKSYRHSPYKKPSVKVKNSNPKY